MTTSFAINIRAFVESEYGEALPPGRWLVVQRTGHVVDAGVFLTKLEALMHLSAYAFDSRAIVDLQSMTWTSVGVGGCAPESFDATSFLAWFRLDPDLAESMVTRLRYEQPRQWDLQSLLTSF